MCIVSNALDNNSVVRGALCSLSARPPVTCMPVLCVVLFSSFSARAQSKHGREGRPALCCRRHFGLQESGGKVLLPDTLEWLWRR